MINKVNIDSVNMQIDSILKDMNKSFMQTGNSDVGINRAQNESAKISFSIESLLRQESK